MPWTGLGIEEGHVGACHMTSHDTPTFLCMGKCSHLSSQMGTAALSLGALYPAESDGWRAAPLPSALLPLPLLCPNPTFFNQEKA